MWALDSGAYSAHNSGVVITNEDFVTKAKAIVANDSRCDIVFALDVIGDPKRSLANAIEAKREGLNVIPTWHAGESLELAQELKRQFPKLALGGLVARLHNNVSQKFDAKTKRRWCEVFFQTTWPTWIHGFGCTSGELMNAYPFASVDSTTWTLRPSKYGSWKTFGRMPIKVNQASGSALRSEIEWFMNAQARHDAKWKNELRKVGCDRFRIRFATTTAGVRKWFS